MWEVFIVCENVTLSQMNILSYNYATIYKHMHG